MLDDDDEVLFSDRTVLELDEELRLVEAEGILGGFNSGMWTRSIARAVDCDE